MYFPNNAKAPGALCQQYKDKPSVSESHSGFLPTEILKSIDVYIWEKGQEEGQTETQRSKEWDSERHEERHGDRQTETEKD